MSACTASHVRLERTCDKDLGPFPKLARPNPIEILSGLWQGGTSESSLLGQPIKPNHYRGERLLDLIVTLYADAQPAPWGVAVVKSDPGDRVSTASGRKSTAGAPRGVQE